MAKNTVYVTRHDMSSLFEKTLKLAGPTWKASLPAVAIVYAPIAVLTAIFLVFYMRSAAGLLESVSSENDPSAYLLKLLGFFGVSLLFSVVASIGAAVAQCAVSMNGFKAAMGEKSTWTSLLKEAVGAKFGKIIVLLLLQGLAYLGLIVVFIVIIVVASVLIALKGPAAVIGGILMGLGIVAVYLGVFGLLFILAFGTPILANEDVSASGAFARTFKLIRGNAWRVIGISLLFTIALYLCLGVAMMPLMIGVMIPFMANVQDLASAMSEGGTMVNKAMADFIQAAMIPYMIIIAVSGIAHFCISPLFQTLFYLDLRVRAGEFPDTEQFSELGAGPDGTAGA